MQIFRTLYFSQIAEQHFGKSMGKVIYVLDQYGPIQYQDVLKYTQFDDLKLLEIVITLGIKHQIIGYKVIKQSSAAIEVKKQIESNKDQNKMKKKYKKKGLIFVNHVALLGREYIPELLSIEKNYNIIIEHAFKNGVFGTKNIPSEKNNNINVETLISELFDKSLLSIVQVESKEEIQEITNKDTKNKTEKKNQKSKKKIEDSNLKQQTDSQDNLLQLNWTGIIDYVKNNTITQYLQQIYGTQNLNDKNLQKQQYKELKQNLEIKWIEDKYSLKHSRVFNLLRMQNSPLDEKQICDMALLNYQDSNSILFELLKDQIIKTKIQKVNDKDKQLYQFDQQIIEEKLQLHFYKGLINCRDKKLYFGILQQMNLMQFETEK